MNISAISMNLQAKVVNGKFFYIINVKMKSGINNQERIKMNLNG